LGILNTVGSLYNYQDVNFIKWLFEYNNNFNLGSTSDSKGDANPLLSLTRPNIIKKVIKSGDYNNTVLNDLGVSINYSFFSWNLFNESKNYRFKDLKSSNMGFLSPDKNTRSTINKNISSTSRDLSYNTAVSQMLNLGMFMETNLFKTYSTSLNEWGSDVSIKKSTSTNLTLTPNHTPLYSNNPNW
jgi:hypothetical protein